MVLFEFQKALMEHYRTIRTKWYVPEYSQSMKTYILGTTLHAKWHN